MAASSVRDIFEAALELAPEDRPAFLDRSCRGQPEMRARVERLLLARTRTGDFLALPTLGAAAVEPGASRIGPYALLAPIGEGGFGTVFLARQEAPIRREVALKILKAGLDGGQVAARFEAERQALATMDHPGIARVFDGGQTESGRLYFVMELVRGDPLTIHCDGASMTIRERLELFVHVAQAVQHAHQKGIIHRDLKPANILVTIQDGAPIPKIIDFGIAKAVGGMRLSSHTVFTEQHQLVGTPQYMSPEQAEGSQDIDTRTDIYSLGVLLYELLTGTTPFEAERLRSASLSEVQRIIREEEPPRPSSRILALQDAAAAEHRRLNPSQLAHTLRSDLDWIILKCLDKDRTRRYQTANALAMDITRYLAGEPVLAAPPSTVYRMRKFVQRHRVPVAAAALVAASVLAAIMGIGLFAVRAAQRAEDTRLVAEFQDLLLRELEVWRMGAGIRDEIVKQAMQSWNWSGLQNEQIGENREQLLALLEGVNFTGVALTSLDQHVFERGIETLDTNFADRPLLRARMLHSLGVTLARLGSVPRARQSLQGAIDVRRQLLGADHLETLESQHAMGVLLARNFPVEAEPFARAALEGRHRTLGPRDQDTLASMRLLGSVLVWQVRFAEAEPLLLGAYQGYRDALGPDDPETLECFRRIGQCYLMSGQLDEAQRYLEEGYSRAQARDPEAFNTLTIGVALAAVRRGQNRVAEAEPLLRAAAAGSARAFGDEHRETLFVRENWAETLMEVADYETAERQIRAVIDTRQRLLGPDHPDSIAPLRVLGGIFRRQQRLEEAETVLREMLERCERSGHQTTATTLWVADILGGLLQDMNRAQDASAIRTRFVQHYLDNFAAARNTGAWTVGHSSGFVEWRGRPHPEPIDDPLQTGVTSRLYHLIRKVHDDGTLIRRFLQVHRDTHGEADPRTYSAAATLAWHLWAEGRLDEAEPLAAEALQGLRGHSAPPDRAFANAMCTVAMILCDRGKPADALRYFEEIQPLIERDSGGAMDCRSAWIADRHAGCLMALGRFADAERLLNAARDQLSASPPPDAKADPILARGLAALYDAWHATDPTAGHDASAQRWRSGVGDQRK